MLSQQSGVHYTAAQVTILGTIMAIGSSPRPLTITVQGWLLEHWLFDQRELADRYLLCLFVVYWEWVATYGPLGSALRSIESQQRGTTSGGELSSIVTGSLPLCQLMEILGPIFTIQRHAISRVTHCLPWDSPSQEIDIVHYSGHQQSSLNVPTLYSDHLLNFSKNSFGHQ